jgi:diguanylate cyclase (GGDEF)-like protein
MEYAFTDPLHATSAGITRRRIRMAHVFVFGGAAISLLVASLADGGPLSQRLSAGGAALVTLVLALTMLSWKRAPDWLLIFGFPFAAMTVTTVAIVDPPLSLTPMYYVWPLLTSAYFLQRRDTWLTYAAVCVSFGAALLFSVSEEAEPIIFMTVVIVGGVVVVFVEHLKRALEEHVARLSQLAREDPLTGALNRRGLMEAIDVEIARSRRAGATCAVALIDVDHFKQINDRFGHATGDDALEGLVKVINARLRAGDLVGRLGGEEFGVLLANTDADGARSYCDGLRDRIAAATLMSKAPYTVSVGVAALTAREDNADTLVAAADAALYLAKRSGRNTVRAA